MSSRKAQGGLVDMPDRAREAVHDLRQPAVCISALVASARASVAPDDPLSWQLDGIDDQVGVLLATMARILDRNEPRTEQQAATSLAHCTREVITAVAVACPDVVIVATPAVGHAPAVRGAPIEVRRALTNIVDNAARAAGPGGRVEISLRRSGPHGAEVHVVVEDSGPGFGKVAPQRMLGLRSATRCLSGVGGSLEVRSSLRLGGACVVLTLIRAETRTKVHRAARRL